MSSLGSMDVPCPYCGQTLTVPTSLTESPVRPVGVIRLNLNVDTEAVVAEHSTVCPCPPNPGGREPLPLTA